MFALALGLCAAIPAGVWTAGVERAALTFDDNPIGAPPTGFFFAGSRQASPGTWQVRGNGAQRHLIHVADPTVTMRGISIAGVDRPAPANLKLTARIRLVDGDRAGGLVWRYRDSENFYFLTVFLSERRVNLIRVTAGNRILLATASEIEPDPDAWHTVTIVHEGDQIRAILNGIGILRARDLTVTEGGRAGVWSAGNSTTWFDDVTIEDYPD